MKIKINVSILILAILLFSCDLFSSKENEPKTELEKLPVMTTTGKNTFGCLLNEEAFVVANTMQMSAIYQGGGIQLSGSIDNGSVDQNVLIVLLDPLEINKVYDLTSLPSHKAMFRNTVGQSTCWYEFSETYKGNLSLLKIDRVNYVISGTFEFSTVSNTCDTIRFTDGRFDIQYIPS